MPSAGLRLAEEVVDGAGHDLEQRRLARAVEADDADLGAGKNDRMMSFSTCLPPG